MDKTDFLELLFERNRIIQLFAIIFTVIYFYAATFVLKKFRERRIKRKNTFIETFIKGVSDNTIENSEDLLNIYSGITNLSTEDLSSKKDLNEWLREILAKLINKEVGQDFSVEQTILTKRKITDFLRINETASPFSDLPDTERNIINDISSYNKTGDSESINRKINELSSVIITRHEQQNKIESLNKWSIPLAIIGLFLTIVFGILSIV
ncbi:hypothetical protein [Flavobacterium algicola]|uniref:hypothetical protein n=1 Tax=Flavobacterium algicola TaxID=556529 RepID=UPI001EFD3F5E|nr:hypothetical protein [Flavobacterium algicola]MCG9792994.1 hypothetical protein [Flavobacterium algicola]